LIFENEIRGPHQYIQAIFYLKISLECTLSNDFL